jgi:hypothetical protein
MGHFARECGEPRKYADFENRNQRNASGPAQFRQPRVTGNIRHVAEEYSDEKVSQGSQEEFDVTSEKTSAQDCFAVIGSGEPARSGNDKLRCRIKIPKQSAEESECEKWVDYIYGRGRKPAHPKTLISESRSEVAANKPLVRGVCDGTLTQLFLDSGAETNVMDANFFFQLQNKNQKLALRSSKGTIRCANGSKMRSVGIAFVKLSFGNVNTVAKFTVVENLFPRVIVGIRTMKGVGMILEPHKDCARVGNEEIPFVSKVVAPSEYQGNENGSVQKFSSGPKLF